MARLSCLRRIFFAGRHGSKKFSWRNQSHRQGKLPILMFIERLAFSLAYSGFALKVFSPLEYSWTCPE